MAQLSSIEWTDSTWNPVTGCTKISSGCLHCYAERMAKRLQIMGSARYRQGFQITLHENLIAEPLKWSNPRMIFVNSMSDLFHEKVPTEFIERVFATMVKCSHHVFQVLTKRSDRLSDLAGKLPWPSNVWMGVTIENHANIERIHHLKNVPAIVRFLSCEPLLGPLNNLPLAGIHWVIVGGESGTGARPLKIQWVDSIRKQCEDSQIPFFFKQWGGVRKDLAGRSLNGRTYDELPNIVKA